MAHEIMNWEKFNTDVDTWIKRENGYMSISAVEDMIKAPFDKEGCAKKCEEKGKTIPGYKYEGMTAKQIMEAWEAKAEESKQYGRWLDEYAEAKFCGTPTDMDLYLLDHDVDGDERLKGHVQAMNAFYDRMLRSDDVKFITRELDVWLQMSDDRAIRGRFDAVFYNFALKKYIVVDWKSNEYIETTPNKWTNKLLGPMKDYYDLSWWKYTLQTSFYKMALLKSDYIETDNPDDVMTLIVNLPAKPYDDVHSVVHGQPYCMFKPAFEYNEDLLTKTFDYALKKKKLLELKAAKK